MITQYVHILCNMMSWIRKPAKMTAAPKLDPTEVLQNEVVLHLEHGLVPDQDGYPEPNNVKIALTQAWTTYVLMIEVSLADGSDKSGEIIRIYGSTLDYGNIIEPDTEPSSSNFDIIESGKRREISQQEFEKALLYILTHAKPGEYKVPEEDFFEECEVI